MKNKVTLFIKSRQEYSADDNELIEYNTEGILYKKREKLYLLYKNKELAEANSRIKVDPLMQEVSIYRDKPQLRQQFIEKESFSSKYYASYGVFDMDIYTDYLSISLGDKNGSIKIVYQIYLNKKYLSKNNLDISWEILKRK
ncbi:YwiB family protein [Natronospora cellulosivora (SeqCode)]